MAAYGLTITPKWYRDQTPRQYTKMGFIGAVYRALCTVGMVPLRAFAPPGISLDNPAVEYAVILARNDTIWWFDYPTADSFTVNGIAYRPIVGIGGSVGNDYTADYMENSFVVHHGYRRADRLALSDFCTFPSLRGVPNYGFGYTNTGFQDSCYGMTGAGFAVYSWRQDEMNSTPSKQAYLACSNLHVVLGPSGLLIQAGTGTGKADSNDTLNAVYCFAGTRVPGRNRIPGQDANLPLINPILPLALNDAATSDETYTNGQQRGITYVFTADGIWYGGARPTSWVLGIQHDLKSTTQPVFAQVFNMENIERPLAPVARVVTLESPRAATPSPSHILNRLVYATWHRWGAATDFYGPLRTGLRSQPSPAWNDIWTANGIRLSDATAPAGEFVDPVSSKTWFMFRAPFINTMVAYDTSLATKYSTYSYTLPVLTDDAYFDLTVGFSGTFPHPVAWNPTGFACDTGLDQMSNLGWTNSQNTYADISGYDAEPAGTIFMLKLDLLLRSDIPSPAANGFNVWVSQNNGSSWALLFQALNPGNDTSGSYYDWTTLPEMQLQLSVDGKFHIRFECFGSAGGAHIARVRNIHVRKYT